MNEKQTGTLVPPLREVELHPWSFIALALATGLAAGALLRLNPARGALKLYLLYKRFV